MTGASSSHTLALVPSTPWSVFVPHKDGRQGDSLLAEARQKLLPEPKTNKTRRSGRKKPKQDRMTPDGVRLRTSITQTNTPDQGQEDPESAISEAWLAGARVKARQGTWSGICLRGVQIFSIVKQVEVASGSGLGMSRTDPRLCRQRNEEKECAQGIRESADKSPTSRGTGARH